MPRSTELLGISPARFGAAAQDPEILGVTADSRLVRPGFLFAALPGAKRHGSAFVATAIEQGAVAVLTDPAGAADLASSLSVPLFVSSSPRRNLAEAAARFHGPQPRIVAAVTGTNGKTSTASFTRQIWQALGLTAASIGTLGIERAGASVPGSLTTPDPVALHTTLAALYRDGIDYAVLEASSHGLEQFRLDGVRFATAAFTNLTQDHLDYHGTLEAYFQAKLRLFAELLPAEAAAVLNADALEYDRLAAVCRLRGQPILDYGRAGAAIRLTDRQVEPEGQSLSLRVLGRDYQVLLPLTGEFQAMNALAALGLAIGSGADAATAVAALEGLSGVRGRLEKIVSLANGAAVFVDYAHTPDGLQQVLTALRPHASGRLVCVFGAGGDRDPGKRLKMGAVVASLADRAIVTDDNPRSEPPAAIRTAILAACPRAADIGDRAMAIETAMRSLGTGDVLVVAGKGHEQGQIVGERILPFDDADIVRGVAYRMAAAS